MSYGEKKNYKQAIWQYLLDHSIVQQDGYMRVKFYIKDRNDLERRLRYRLDGFERYKEEDIDKERKANIEMIIKLKTASKYSAMYNRKKDKVVKDIKESNNIYKKLILYIHRKTRHYLYGHLK